MNRLNNHNRMILGAMRTGAKDSRTGTPADASAYGARKGSAWAKHYELGHQGHPLPDHITSQGVEL